MECWDFLKTDYRIEQFIINLELFYPKLYQWIKLPNVIIDTGYDGDLLIPYTDFNEAGFLSKFNYKKQSYQAETITGATIDLVSSFTKVKISNKEIPVEIESFKNSTEFILGRGVLIKGKWIINGIEEKFCQLE